MFALILLPLKTFSLIKEQENFPFSCKYNGAVCAEDQLPTKINSDSTTTEYFLLSDKCTSRTNCYPYEMELDPGQWTFELWGTSGHKNDHTAQDVEEGGIKPVPLANTPGYGAYVSGVLKLTEKKKFWFYVGSHYGFNGGAQGDNEDDLAAQGGSASDVRFFTEEQLQAYSGPPPWDDFNSLKNRIIVAGAGGGQERVVGGNAGAFEAPEAAFNKSWNKNKQYIIQYATGGTQTSGGRKGICWGYEEINPTTTEEPPYSDWHGEAGQFGIGGKGTDGTATDGGGAGGSGYFGGGGIALAGAGGGGSSFVSGKEGCRAITGTSTAANIEFITGTEKEQSIHYSGIQFSDPTMIAGGETMPLPSTTSLTDEGKGYTDTHGYIRLSYIADPPTEPPTQPPTDPPTQPPTDPPTQPPTEKPTKPPTEKPTKPPTEKPTQPPTEKPTQPPTEKPNPATPVPEKTENQEGQTTSKGSDSKSTPWAIIGGVAGGLVVAGIVALVIFKLRPKPEKMHTENFTTLSSPQAVITQDNPLYKDGDDVDDPFQNDFEENQSLMTANQL